MWKAEKYKIINGYHNINANLFLNIITVVEENILKSSSKEEIDLMLQKVVFSNGAVNGGKINRIQNMYFS